MKNKTLTFVQFYKANHTRRDILTKRFGFKSSDELMKFLKKNGSVTTGINHGVTINSYEEFKKMRRSEQLTIAVKNGYSTRLAFGEI